MTRRNWILGFFIAALCLGIIGAIFLMLPREPEPMSVGVEHSFRYSFDPHLFLNIDEVSFADGVGDERFVRIHVVATNTAVGDMTIDLSDLRFALVGENGETLNPVHPVWRDHGVASTTVFPRSALVTDVELAIPADVRPVAVLAWEDYAFLRVIPAARGSVLCPTLRLSLEELAGAAQPLR